MTFGRREFAMAVHHLSAAAGQRPGDLLSADNPPERHIVLSILRKAAPALGLKPPVLATLDAMLSFLPPQRGHHMVFASNESLVSRLNGLSERTIRRHVEQLVDSGLIARRDSPNRKRFTRRNRTDGLCLRFGFDLAPLFSRLGDFARIAAQMDELRERLDYLRAKLRAAAHLSLARDAEDTSALAALRALRRKLTVEDCAALLDQLSESPVENALEDAAQPEEMTGNDGQNVRHHHRSTKENIDKARTISAQDVVEACPEAAAFAQEPVKDEHQLVRHGRTLAPMLGISPELYAEAEKRIGIRSAALTIWAMVQMQDRIGRFGAYFRSLTLGPRSAGFDPARLIRSLARQTAPSCPRTI
ncbi:plasmid replication protein RepC (plasmid) [Salipiger sp. H15]|uniref:Plasmid replication protein RepC n=1 Tax=Alloyangia sp. H15 TaxID=3029062 RepID=A0AAU8AQ80_9RHOB